MESSFRLVRDHIGSPIARPRITKRSRAINLLPLDSTLPNLALEKVAMHYRAKGYTIISDYRAALNGMETWASLILDHERERFASLYGEEPNIRIGGSGWDLASVLPDEIEQLRPKINFGSLHEGASVGVAFALSQGKKGPSIRLGTSMICGTVKRDS